MTKKHFQAIADVIRDFYSIGATANLESLSEELALEFEKINPNFDREKFLRACGTHD